MSRAQKTTFAELIDYSRFRDRIRRLKALFSDDPEAVVPWVGAGLSTRYGMPLWSSFVQDLIERMPEPDRPAADYLRSEGLFDLAADFAHMRLGDTEFASSMVRAFNRSIDHAQPHPIAGLHSRMVVTTNYDRVLELSMPWLLPLLPQTFSQHAFRNEDVLLKLHGTIENRESWVLTRFQYATAYREELWEELRALFARRTVLFLGCSLRTDMFLDVLRQMSSGRTAPHYAILHVADDDQAKARGEELERLGISVIPYITGDGDHSIVDRILAEVRPTLQKTLAHAERARQDRALDRAMRILTVESGYVSDDVVARAQIASRMADVLRDYRDAHPDPGSWATDRVVRLAQTAATLDPASDVVVGVAVDILRLAGRSDAGLEQHLERLRRPVAEGSVSETDDRDVRLAYRHLRAGSTSALLRQLEGIERRGKHDRDRLSILRLRALLLLDDSARAEPVAGRLSHPIRPFGDALLAFARNELAECLAALDVLETRWRASSGQDGRPGLVFSLSLRALAHLGQEDYRTAERYAARAIAAHDPNARQAARRFRLEGIPSELCYDVRRLGSSELRTILACVEWLCRAAQRPSADANDLLMLRELVHRLDRDKAADRLLRWYWMLLASLLPDAPSQDLRRTFDDLLRDTRSQSGRHAARDPAAFPNRESDRVRARDSDRCIRGPARGGVSLPRAQHAARSLPRRFRLVDGPAARVVHVGARSLPRGDRTRAAVRHPQAVPPHAAAARAAVRARDHPRRGRALHLRARAPRLLDAGLVRLHAQPLRPHRPLRAGIHPRDPRAGDPHSPAGGARARLAVHDHRRDLPRLQRPLRTARVDGGRPQRLEGRLLPRHPGRPVDARHEPRLS